MKTLTHRSQRTDTIFLEYMPIEKKVNDTFFSRIVPEMKNDKFFFQREDDLRLDRIGVDAVMAYKSKIDYVDLKHHRFKLIQEMHPQYAFELETGWRDSDETERHDGWFVHRSKVTGVYGFLFWDGTPDRIEHMRVCLIRKQDIIQRLKSFGIDIEHWHERTKVQPKLYNGNYYWFIYENIRIAQSLSLPEKPVNLVIPWQYLEDIVIYDKLFCLSDSRVQVAA